MSTKSVLSAVALTSAVVLTVAADGAEVYRWVAEDGSVTFSETKPPGQRAERIDVHVTQPSAQAIQDLRRTLDAAEEAGQAQEEREAERAKEQRVAAQKADNCRRARANLEQLQSAIRLYHTNSAGDRTKVGEEERQAGIESMREIIERDCS